MGLLLPLGQGVMKQQFPVIDKLIHLNHAAVGSWPTVTADAVKAFAEENIECGSLHYSSWLKTEQSLRQRLAALIHASSADEIALVKNTSEGLSFVAYGLAWRPGDNVVGIQQEFPSNRFVWDSLADKGVEFRKLDLQSYVDPEQALFDLCDSHTRLLSISAVQYHDGFKMDLARIGQFCRDKNILFCVDAIQQIGALPFDVQATGIDFAIADGHKWMLAPEGLGLFYIRQQVMDRLAVHQYGWHMTEPLSDYSQLDFVMGQTARRFECGSPNMLGIHALNASIGLLLESGMESIGSKVIENSHFIIEQLRLINGIDIISNDSEKRLSGIVTFRSETVSNDKLYEKLSEQGVLCAPRGGGIRLSPHFYNPRDQLEHALSIVRSAV